MVGGGVLSIREVNALEIEQFEWLFGNIIEHCPEAARAAALQRPFRRVVDLKIAFCHFLDGLDTRGKESVLFNHPDLASKHSDGKKLTQESETEQNTAGIDAMTREERLTLNNLNQMYKDTFSFPFVICARENRVQTILTAIEERLKNSREVELKTGIDEVKKISSLRINDLVWPDA
ncbi:2-oxo-4-hydroxy-4-carboxy-5-ureidoimidazoline decarboxylase [Fopius arisanus]|uniref:2-oxo-4-hydroxy-4-carboxy-5-ureidoimidazoline decarboxylase n=1 Tax=Fopius arisanus TaxID=64838 RepID=A0A0C9RRY6_9HYME|nr:PREDICTED: 2-oxo-4-hydroxy-4-carboxy-5-ureidoimidazoline decarboxylase-like [Fopius arisanus]XP_011297345.1 PREDICTED: 2-oxo-4-hydroxy-4-carboxy-5-ureidoimidazoline decarboxylase-like [Fopius arisanus]XP_011297353.1 PREDICTED: 2-oxo-4-hydroxy-4-carboxy-5-ureidoimidazoline decarboxylase-like [Fopius arisanus]XP_011297361.1 PREDICTED: 2-oxo-4-hydroxy-4-carboxy-5-ureidoimidazoline decarboxylase-like [Fopius arisanus]XP_011297369.1 PREDICTED: 2-oxo-4-hydroxy-4-carboxy-5-ureidoimidazoline decarbo